MAEREISQESDKILRIKNLNEYLTPLLSWTSRGYTNVKK